MTDLKPALVRLLRATYPHPDFPDGPYERTADIILSQIENDVWHRVALDGGLASLAATGFADLADDAAEEVLRRIADTEFFAFVRGAAVPVLYDDHEIWELLGYEGPSFEKGGYLHRGFDDLDWLPDPRIEEYDGPEELVEVAEQDQPAGA